MTKHKEALEALVVLYNAKAINTDNETMRAAYETVEKALQAVSWQSASDAPFYEDFMVWWRDGCWWGQKTKEQYNNGEYVWQVKFGNAQMAANPSHYKAIPAAPVDGGG